MLFLIPILLILALENGLVVPASCWWIYGVACVLVQNAIEIWIQPVEASAPPRKDYRRQMQALEQTKGVHDPKSAFCRKKQDAKETWKRFNGATEESIPPRGEKSSPQKRVRIAKRN